MGDAGRCREVPHYPRTAVFASEKRRRRFFPLPGMAWACKSSAITPFWAIGDLPLVARSMTLYRCVVSCLLCHELAM